MGRSRNEPCARSPSPRLVIGRYLFGLLRSPVPRYRQAMTNDPDMLDLDAAEDDALDVEIAALRASRAFASAMEQVPWMAALGKPLTEAVRNHADGYCTALGFPHTTPLVVTNVEEAMEAALNLEFDTAAFEAEEQTRLSLAHDCVQIVGEDLMRLALTQIDQASAHALDQALPAIVDHWEMDDQDFMMAIMGAGVRAAHGAGLVLVAKAIMAEEGYAEALAELDDHAFHHNFALYTNGRWPIGITGSSLNIF